jgi:hypothetical protein
VPNSEERSLRGVQSDFDPEFAELCREASKQSRATAGESRLAGKWISTTFHFVRFLKSRAEFCDMEDTALRLSPVWSFTNFSEDEIFNACLEWKKIKPGFAKDRLFSALTLAQSKPVRACEQWGHLKVYGTFLSLAYYLQLLTGDGEIFLPCDTVAPLIGVTSEIVSRYRQRAITDGFLAEVEKATARRATRFRVQMDRFRALELLH